MPSPTTKEDDAATIPDAKTMDEPADDSKAKEDESKKQSLTSSSSIEKDDAVPNEESKKSGAAVETPVETEIKRDSPDISPSSESKSESESKHGKVAGTSSSSDKEDHKLEEKNKMNGIQEGNHANNGSSSAASSSSCAMKMYDKEIKTQKDDSNDVEIKDKKEENPNDKLNNSVNEKKKNSSSEISAWANMNMAQPSYILPTECDVLLDSSSSSSEGEEGETLQKCSVQEIQYHPANVLLHDLISLHAKLLSKQKSTTFNTAATSIITQLKQGAVHSTSRQLLNTTTNTTNTTPDMIRSTMPTPPKQGRFLKRTTNSSKHNNKSEEQEKEKHFYKNSNGNQPPFSVISHYSWEEASEEKVIDFVVELLKQCLLEAKNADVDESTVDAKHKEKQQDSAESTNNMIEVQRNDVLLLNSHPKDDDANEETNKNDTDVTLAQEYKDHVGNANYLRALEEKVSEFGSQNIRPCSVSSNQRAALALSIVDGILQQPNTKDEKEKQGRFLIRKGNEWKLTDKTSAAEMTTSLLCTKCIQADRHRRARQKCLEGSNIVTAGSYRPKRKAKEELAKTVLTMATTVKQQPSSSSSLLSQRPTKKQKQSQPNKTPNGSTTTTPNNPNPKTPTPTTTQGIQTPTEHDVLFGRGGLTNSHIGNRRFRDIIALHRPDYVSAPKVEKPNVARRIVRAIRGADPPGRFLKKSTGLDGLWYDVGDKHAAEKTSQALREKSQEERYRKATKRRLEAKTKRLEKEVNRAAAAAAAGSSGGGSSLDAAVRYLKDSRNAAVAAAAGAVPPPATMHVMQGGGGGVAASKGGGAPITPLPAGVHLAHPPTMVQGSVHPSLLHNTDASQLKHTQLLPHHPPPPGVAHHHPPPPGYPLHPSAAAAAAAAAAGRMGAHPHPPPHGHLAVASYGRGHPMPSAPSSQQPAPGPAPTGTTTKKGAKKATAKDKETSKTDKPPTPTPPATTTTTGIITKITKEMIPTTHSPPVPPFSVIGLTDGAGNIIVTENDILCGRGGLTNHHRGNKRFRDIVSLHRPDYILATKVQKPAVSRLIVAAIRNGNPPGRFLKKDDKTGRWFDIGDKRAAEKASQALREKPSEERGGAGGGAAGRVSPGPYSSVVQGQGTVNVPAAAASVASPMNSVASGVPPAQPAAAVVAQHSPPPAPNAIPPSVKKESPAKVQTTTTTTPPPPPTEKTNDDTVATQSVTV